jgi:pyruvate ferredoxin oxidoreductase gamma subunit
MWLFSKKKEALPLRKSLAVRMEAIGGQGANSAGKILAEAGVLGMKFTGNHFSSFGSEKRGSPVKSFVRLSLDGKPVRSASSIESPDLIVVFHESLIESFGHCLVGASENTDILINSRKSPQEIKFPKGMQFRNIVTVDALALSQKFQCGVNSVLLGAISELCPEVKAEVLSQTLVHFFSKLSEKAQKKNQDGFLAGAEKIREKSFSAKQASLEISHAVLPQMGFMNAPLGGIISNPGNTVLKDHSASRKGVMPKFFSEVCFSCGYCDMVCPDFCFVWGMSSDEKPVPKLFGIDYQYCKGCQKCVVACPVQALVPVAENEIGPEEKLSKLFPEVTPQKIEAHWRGVDWAKMVDDMSPEARMMTLQTELLDPKSYLRPDFSEILKKKRVTVKSES